MYPLVEHEKHVKEVFGPIRWDNFYFRVFIEHNYGCYLGRPLAISIYSIFPLCMKSNAFEKFTNEIFAQTPKILRIIRILYVVHQLLQKPFWFFRIIFSNSGFIRMSSRALQILTAMEVRVTPRQFLTIPRSPIFRKGMMQPFTHHSRVLCLYTALQYRSSRSSNFFVFVCWYYIKSTIFLVFSFSLCDIEFFLSILS